MEYKQKVRARIILGAVICIAFIIVVSLYMTQVVNGAKYANKANEQYSKTGAMLLERGDIYFSSKDNTKIQAATIKSGYKIFINPALVDNPESTYEALKEYIDIDKDGFIAKARKTGDYYEELAKQMGEEQAFLIKNLGLSGVGIAKETWRIYPGDTMASHELGILGESASSTSLRGRYGLERYYESVLSRINSASKVNAFAELFSDAKESIFSDNKGKQGDIITSIDTTVEAYLEKILQDISGAWRPESVGGIIIDPNTGEIVAMSSLPNFDPNNTKTIKDVRVFSNPLVESAYEMGSIMKPLTMSVALDTGAVNPSSTYEDTGTMTLSGKKISNHDGKARGVTSMQDILAQSLNVGAATIALKVGKDGFSKYFLNFGLGSKTGIDLPNEASGLVGNLRTGRDVEIATAAFGQGIAVSPVAMARALSILANGGYLIKPHLVKEIDYTDGSIEKVKAEKLGPYLNKETTDEVTNMLVKVVDESLLKGAIKMERYSIAAKTGTAQIADPVNGGYYKDRYLHSFFGYFPAYNPKYLIFLYQVYPKGTEYASATLTEPFASLTKFLIDYYNIAPDR